LLSDYDQLIAELGKGGASKKAADEVNTFLNDNDRS
jgi:hypothetical protein